MQIIDRFSHRGASDIIAGLNVTRELDSLFDIPTFNLEKGVTPHLHSLLNEQLLRAGWACDVAVSALANSSITAKKGSIGFQLQTGNIARAFYDILKFQSLYVTGSITVSVLAVPSTDMAKRLGSNVAAFDRLQKELTAYAPAISCPTLLIGIGGDA
jgi:hypothetical protein